MRVCVCVRDGWRDWQHKEIVEKVPLKVSNFKDNI